jgi:hypothetical protein
MASAAVETLIKMVESVPEPVQEKLVERVRELLHEMREDLKWEEVFARSQNKLADEAREVRKQIRSGLAEPMDLEKL